MAAQRPDFAKAIRTNLIYAIVIVAGLMFGFFVIRPMSTKKSNTVDLAQTQSPTKFISKSRGNGEYDYTFPAMGKIPVYLLAKGIEQQLFDNTCLSIKSKLKDYEDLLSTYKEDSLISLINSGQQIDEIPDEITKLIQSALDTSVKTDGAFDITVGPLVSMWKSAAKEKRLPTDEEKKSAFKNVGYKRCQIIDGKLKLEPGTQIDLGAIAKGWMADIIVEDLKAAGATRCIGQVGGDIMMWDSDPKGTFEVGIKNPLEPDKVLTTIQMPACAMETSGDYYRFYEINGKKYNHIFDPRTGEPVDTMLSVTLFGPNGTQVDPLGTALYVMGVQKAMEFLAKYPEFDAVFIEKSSDAKEQFKITVTPRLADKLNIK